MADYSDLKRRAQEIRDEVKAGANTANRVGVALEGIVNALEEENLRATGKENDLGNDIQSLQDETEDLQSMRDAIDSLGTDKADKSALEVINKEVEKKQDILEGYREYPSKGAVEISGQEKVSMSVDYHENIAEVSTYYEDTENNGIVPVARIESTYESGDYAYVETRGNEVNIYGDYVNVNGFELMQTIEDVATLNMRVYELGDFPTSGDAENAAKNPKISGNEAISIIHYTVNGTTDGLILQHQDIDNGYYRSLQTLFYHSRVYVRFVWFTDSTRTVLLENANFNRDWWETSISHLEYDKTTHTIKCRRIGQDVNSTKWITLPSASTSTDGLMTMAQVKSLEGKQDQLANYEEVPRGKTTIKYPNGTARVEVSNVRAALWANDDKVAIAADANGTRMLYQKTAEDGSIEHRDEISIGKHDENSATHITLTSKSTTEEDGVKSTRTSTMSVTPEKISMTSINGEIDDVVKEINDKAPKVGYAPDLKVNFAKELVGRGEATPEVIGGIRPTGVRSIGDGNATIERIKGESVVWNQLVDGAIAFKHMSTQDNITYTPTVPTLNGNVYHKLGVAKGSHKYLCTGSIVNSKGFTPTAGDVPLNTVFSIKDGKNIYLSPLASSEKNVTTEDWARIEEPIQFHDLTQMFGAGNEPTTIEEFEARKPLGVTNEYNEGTIISYDGDALKSVGFNAYNGTYAKVIGGEEYHATGTTSISFAKELGGDVTAITLDSNKRFIPEEDGYVYAEGKDIVIHLTHSYTPEHVDEYEEDVHVLPDVKSILDANGNQLFPYGLASAGSAHDEITATKAVKRVGVVDMGTLNWGRFAEADIYVFQATPTNIGIYSNTTSIPNLLSKAYPSVIRADIKTKDKCISQNNGAKAIVIRDDTYTDATTFKASLSGVLLYYELAEPIEVDLPEPLNMTYEAWDFGTEELIHEGATTPLNADIVYQFNAVDRIRENTTKNTDLENRIAALEAMITQLTAQTTNYGGTDNE